MTALAHLSPGVQAVYAALVDLAEAGKPCPGNRELALVGQFKTHGGAVHAVSCLKNADLIEIWRGQSSRVIRITATGKMTAGRVPEEGKFRAKRAGAGVLDRLPPRVDRDPCPRCGVRADVGCQHLRAQQSQRQGMPQQQGAR